MALAGGRVFVTDDDRTVLTYLKAVLGGDDRVEQLVPIGPDLLFIQKPGKPVEVLNAVRSLLAGH
jgi:hypothetical protein